MMETFDDVVDQRLDVRRREMAVALRWSASLLIGFILVTLDVIYQGLLWRIDQFLAEVDRPKFSGTINFFILRIDDLSLIHI